MNIDAWHVVQVSRNYYRDGMATIPEALTKERLQSCHKKFRLSQTDGRPVADFGARDNVYVQRAHWQWDFLVDDVRASRIKDSDVYSKKSAIPKHILPGSMADQLMSSSMAEDVSTRRANKVRRPTKAKPGFLTITASVHSRSNPGATSPHATLTNDGDV